MSVLVRHMRSRLGRSPSAATVLASMALFVSLSGVAYAAATIGSAEVIDNSLMSIDLKDGAAVTSQDVVNDALTGTDVNEASLKGVARKIVMTAPGTEQGSFRSVGPVGGYTFLMSCIGVGSGVNLQFGLDGPSGDFQVYGLDVTDDTSRALYSSGGLMAGGPVVVTEDGANNGHFRRKTGTLWIHSGLTLVQLDFHLFIDARAVPGSCTAYGTATWDV